MKKLFKKLIGHKMYIYLAQLWILYANFHKDLQLYKKYSTVFDAESFENKEAQIILAYHSLEKGFLFSEMKPNFGKMRVAQLNKLLNDPEVINNAKKSQINVAYQIMCRYYELHLQQHFNTEDYFPEKYYLNYKKILAEDYSTEFEGIIKYNREAFYKNNDKSFEVFASSRKSIRNFTGEKISQNLIEEAIKLASTAPSVCNRQASRVYVVEDKIKIDQILKIQGGMTGYTEGISQLLILTNDRNYYYTIGERNQFYIDGGLFLMNLLYALHFYEIAACPANWGKRIDEEEKLKQFITLPESEKIICMIPIGIATDDFNVCLSKRRRHDEILTIV